MQKVTLKVCEETPLKEVTERLKMSHCRTLS